MFKSIYMHNRFFYVLSIIVSCFATSYFFPNLFDFCWVLIGILATVAILDFILLWLHKNPLSAHRNTPDKFSNGDENDIELFVQNGYSFTIHTEVIDELPEQLQERNFSIKRSIPPGKNLKITYKITPKERGEYHYGNMNVFTSSVLKIFNRKFIFDGNKMVPVYPSFIHLKKYDLLAFSNNLTKFGFKKIRKIGLNSEFEKIKEYVVGEDFRHINWKATAKKNQLMINQYQDEKSQPVYCIIDKGRTMKMPFNGLSLLDYAINSTLVLSSIILKKQDKVGMFTFSKNIENTIQADKKGGHLSKMIEGLYNIETNFEETDFHKLYIHTKKNITHRSLLILFSNFETMESLNRQLPFLKAIARSQVLLVVFFENTEIDELIKNQAKTVKEIYHQTIAQKFEFEKKLIVKELNKYGIQTLLSKPENLTVDSINKYLEIKARGLI